MNGRTVSILGCGWLGLPLAERLSACGYRVKGATTTPEKVQGIAATGAVPYLLRLDPELQGDASFFEADALFLNIPPPREPDALPYHVRQIDAVLEAFQSSPDGLVVFASTTSVYPNLNRVVTEDEAGPPTRPSGAAVLAAERRLQQGRPDGVTILRFAGLYGYDRQPGRFLAGRRNLPNGEAPVNLVHRDDCIGSIEAVLAQDVRGEVLNVCADVHPTRATFYTAAAHRLGLVPPTFDEAAPLAFKVVSNAKLKRRLGYRFQHPDPAEPAP